MTKEADRLIASKRAQARIWFLSALGGELLMQLAQALKGDKNALSDPLTWIFAGIGVFLVVRQTFGPSPTDIEPVSVDGIGEPKR